ncbi:hypothetical protein MCAL160_0385 [Mycoplasmopsis californica HAZ160_1]|uniref:Uncharacterized protein n=2 Tax=Mycoplasmopsis californica TaxID=2113 RepID=A0A059XRX1_9BACT|nr:peptidase M22 [Mycoplasmopsis californica]AIA29568.1 hypothetical protein MCFN_02150 [Mycoplasmopsis californica]BAP00988.1 hypothetical protein MCAL160_0385 [Mycoplasmopsis californica HAZ160_1]BBG40853.1 hypothetical protein MCAL106_0385 [Mycoplasmopsis californica]BBG41447.1 hypothetical protein MCAL106E_0385 [Mycoplasmopsis californica]BBG42040.1 hypothetical protein MCAL106L_0385 [Mycoplasmopsis californica]
MKLYLDTTGEKFVIAAFNQNNNLIASYIITEPKKVPLIPFYCAKICNDLNIKINKFTHFYTNLGPGLFTGVRISLVYLRTIAMITNAKIKTISSMQILAMQNPNKNELFINASGNKHYYYSPKSTEFTIEDVKIMQNNNTNFDVVDYNEFLENFTRYEPLFKEWDEIINIEPYYIKSPQIGV